MTVTFIYILDRQSGSGWAIVGTLAEPTSPEVQRRDDDYNCICLLRLCEITAFFVLNCKEGGGLSLRPGTPCLILTTDRCAANAQELTGSENGALSDVVKIEWKRKKSTIHGSTTYIHQSTNNISGLGVHSNRRRRRSSIPSVRPPHVRLRTPDELPAACADIRDARGHFTSSSRRSRSGRCPPSPWQ